jgi:gluconolactonase
MNDARASGANVEIRDARFRAVVGDDVTFERIATGFLFVEGPLWHPAEKSLLFSDMPGDHLRKWTAQGVATYRKPCAQSNGLAWDRQGRLIVCEHATSQVTRTESDGRSTVIAAHHDGKELNSPNDVVVKTDGGIYFTDPTYGRNEYFGNPRPLPRDFRGVYRAEPEGGKVTLLADDFAQPNGLCFSRDERQLFVNDTERGHIRVFDVDSSGALANSRVFAETRGEGAGAPDGMKIDGAGNIYCCGPGGIHVFDPVGICLGVIRMPEYSANFCFGDDDLRSLYVTASTSVYRLRVAMPGTAQMQTAR